MNKMDALINNFIGRSDGVNTPAIYTLDEDVAHRVMDLLKAGQAMRNSLGVLRYLTKDGTRAYRQAEVGDNKLAVESIESWDAALGEEDV